MPNAQYNSPNEMLDIREVDSDRSSSGDDGSLPKSPGSNGEPARRSGGLISRGEGILLHDG